MHTTGRFELQNSSPKPIRSTSVDCVELEPKPTHWCIFMLFLFLALDQSTLGALALWLTGGVEVRIETRRRHLTRARWTTNKSCYRIAIAIAIAIAICVAKSVVASLFSCSTRHQSSKSIHIYLSFFVLF